MGRSNTAVYIVKPYVLVQNAFKLINKIVKCIRTFITEDKRGLILCGEGHCSKPIGSLFINSMLLDRDEKTGRPIYLLH